MDQTHVQQKIAEYYAKLPPNAQEVFASMTWMETLRGISARYSLNEDQIATLATEATLALLGIVHPDEFEETIIKELGIPVETINKILDKIHEKILKPVRGLLREAFIKNTNDLIDPILATLPENFQDALGTSDYKEKLSLLATKYNISSPEKLKAFENAALKLITKSYSENQFQGALILATNMEVAMAKEVTREINEGLGLEIQKKADEYAKTAKKEEVTVPVPLPPYAPKPKAPSYTEKIPEAPQPTQPNVLTKTEPPVPSSPTPVQKTVFSNAGIEMIGASSHPTPTGDIPKKVKDPYHEEI